MDYAAYRKLLRARQEQRAGQANALMMGINLAPQVAGQAYDTFGQIRAGTNAQDIAMRTQQMALEQGNTLIDWLNDDPVGHPPLVDGDLPAMVNFERATNEAYRAINGRGFGIGVRGAWIGTKESAAGAARGVANVRASSVEQLYGELVKLRSGVPAAQITPDPTRQAFLMAYEGMDDENFNLIMDRMRASVLSEEFVQEKLEDLIDRFSRRQQSIRLGRVTDLTDIRDYRGFVDFASVVGGEVVASLALYGAAGRIGGAAGLFSYVTLSEGGGMLAEADLDKPGTLPRILFTAPASGLVELIGGVPTRALGIRRQLWRRAFSDVTEDVLDRTVKGYARRLGKDWVMGASEEMLQEAAQFFLSEYGVKGEDFRFDNETLVGALNAAAAGLMGGFVGQVGMGTRHQIAIESAARATRDAGLTVHTIEELAAVTKDLQLAKISKEGFASWTKKLGLDNLKVFYQADVVQDFVSAQGLNLESTLKMLGVDPADFAIAAANGHRIPVSAAGVVRVGLTDEANVATWSENATFRPDGATMLETKAFKDLRAQIEREIAEQAEVAALSPSRAEVMTQVTEQAVAAGRPAEEAAQAGVVAAAWFETMAQMYGGGDVSGADLFRRYGFEIRGAAKEGAAPEDQPAAQLPTRDQVLNQPPPGESILDRADVRNPRGSTYQGVGPQYTIPNPSTTAPRRALILGKTNAGNAAAQSEALDVLKEHHPEPLSSVAAWAAFANDAVGLDRLPMPPFRTIEIVNEGAPAITREIGQLPEGMVQEAEQGLAMAKRLGVAYESGTVTPATTAKLFLWSFLSRGVSPYVQEAAFLDAVMDPRFDELVDAAMRVGWTPELAASYAEWAAGVLPPGTPGRGTTHNLNAFGTSFLRVMSQRYGEAGGKTGLELIHDMVVEGKASKDIRREFLRIGDGAGIDNKVVSFTLLLMGRDDVLVLDRVQMRNQFDDGRFTGQNIYDSDLDADGKQVTGSAAARLTFGHTGLMYYETMEAALAPLVKAAYKALGREGSLGRYHWDSWLLASAQEVGHASVEGLVREATGDPAGFIGTFVRQGKFASYDYGFRYTVMPDGSRATIVPLFNGGAVVVSSEEIGTGKPLHTGLRRLVTQAKRADPQSGITKPWHAALTAEQKGIYDGIVGRAGTPADTSGADTADAVGRDLGVVLEQSTVEPRGDAGRGDPGGQPGGGAPVRQPGGGRSGAFEVDPDDFVATAREALGQMGPVAAQVGTDPGDQAFFLDDGLSGYALSGDNVISVFSSVDSPPGVAGRVLRDAVARGGRRLDGFDTFLPGLYAKHGFRAVARLAFDDGYAPAVETGAGADWDYGAMAKWNGGLPDVVFMVYDPQNASPETGNVVPDYDAGIAAQDEALAALSEQPQTLQQPGPRGMISLPDGLTSRAIITLMESADASTLMHEMGHFFLEGFRTMAMDANAPKTLRDDLDRVNAWLGRGPDDMSAFTREQQEQWAEAFEKYLATGVAPSSALKAAFHSFKRWLAKIYAMVPFLHEKLDPEIVDIFDRMLATEEEIEAAKVEESMGPLLLSKPPGMAEETYELYRRAAGLADAEGSAKLLAKAMKTVLDRRTEEFRKRRAELTEEYTAGMAKQRHVQLVEGLRATGAKLSREQLMERFGPAVITNLERYGKGANSIVRKGGTDLEIAAELGGYDSADAMIGDLTANGPLAEMVGRKVRTIMANESADLLSSGEMRREAVAALHNNERWNTLAMEEAEIRRQVEEVDPENIPARFTVKEARTLAASIMADTSVQVAENPEVFLRTERQAGRAAQEAFGRVARAAAGAKLTTGARADLMKAHAAKRKQLLNSILYAEAKKVQADVRHIKALEKRVKKARRKGKKPTIASPFLEELEALLEQYDFRKISAKQTWRIHGLQQLIKQMEDAGFGEFLLLDPDVVANMQRKPYGAMTTAQLRGLKDSLDNLEHLGRKEMKGLYGEKSIAFTELKRGALTILDMNFADQEVAPSATSGERRAQTAHAILNSFQTPDTLTHKWDKPGKDDVGFFGRAIKIPLQQAMARVQARQHEARMAYDALLERHYGGNTALSTQKVFRKEIGASLTKAELLAIALNTGNVENMQRLMSSRKGRGFTLTEASLQELLDAHMTETDWRFVQDVWDLVNSYWGEIATTQRARTGVYPKKVDAQMGVTAPAFVRGGYYPIRYDKRLGVNVSEFENNDIFKMMRSGQATQAQTRNGHTKERKAAIDKALDLSLSVGVAHINDVILDLEMGGALSNAWRLMNDPDVSSKFKDKGLEQDRVDMLLALQDAALGDRQPAKGLDVLFRHLRGGLSISRMAFSATTLIQQVLGLTSSAVAVGKGYMARGIWKYATNPAQTAELVRSVSPFMVERQRTMERDIIAFSGELDENPVYGKMKATQKVIVQAGFAGIQKLQYYAVDLPTWLAAYQKHMDRHGDPAGAAEAADLMVSRAQGSGLLSDRSGIERGSIHEAERFNEIARMLTTFGSYMISGKLNLTLQRFRSTDFKKPGDVASLVVDMMLMYVAETLLALAITNRWFDDEEDDEGLPLWMAKEIAYGIMGTVPILRDAPGTLEGFGGGGSYGDIIDAIFSMPGDITTLATGLDERPDAARNAVKGLMQGTGLMLHLPSVQLERALTALFERDMSKRDDFSALDLAFGRND